MQLMEAHFSDHLVFFGLLWVTFSCVITGNSVHTITVKSARLLVSGWSFQANALRPSHKEGTSTIRHKYQREPNIACIILRVLLARILVWYNNMFRRMTPPRPKVERAASETSSGGPEYSESGPELENAIINKNWSLVRKYAAQGYGIARRNLLHKAVRNGAPTELLELLIEKGCSVDELQEVRRLSVIPMQCQANICDRGIGPRFTWRQDMMRHPRWWNS
jgi:hypothetical protein